MEANQSCLINKIFTIPYLDKVIANQDRTYLEEYVSKYVSKESNLTWGKVIDEIYQQMDQEHRNEYFYKNTMMNRLLVEKEELSHTAVLTELPIAESKADMVLINGRGVVYEIKTDLDDFTRLENQINDYYKVFSYVNVVVSYKQYPKVREMLRDTKVGIYVLYDSGSLLPRKRAMCNREQLSYDSMFQILRKNEYESILQKYQGKLPGVSSFFYYQECRKRIGKLGITTLQKEVQECLKRRTLLSKENIIHEEKVPYALRFFAYFSREGIKRYERIVNFIGDKVGG